VLKNEISSTGVDTFFISVSLPADSWSVDISPSDAVEIPESEQERIFLKLTIPAGWPVGKQVLTITATRASDNEQVSTFFTVNLQPGPAGPACPEESDPGNDKNSASTILVDRAETHGICTKGDEDWFKFGAIANKVYSLVVTEMDKGLDLSLDLYDEQGHLLDSNDDNTSTQPMTDTKPLIRSFHAPRDGLYYVRVRDTLNIGGSGLSYTFVVVGESYGSNPNTAPPNASVCNDRYEQDGLPELAKLILSNETQKEHILCPNTDADWVKFFGLAEYTYAISTTTAPYGSPEPGADTLLFLFGRDGVTLIGSNNNYSNTLDSLILFTPTIDGFYFAQVKNVGDIGNQFIKYDLKLTVCLPGQCGLPLPNATEETTPTQSTAEQPVASAPPSTGRTPDPNRDDSLFLPPNAGNSLPPGFADLAFAQVWQRADQPVAQHRAARSWMWGPRALAAQMENYAEANGGRRQVQYFDKGRMEINNPNGDRSSRWFVTSGLLVVELVTGRMQIGGDQYDQRSPANIPVAGDIDDPNAPTYGSWSEVFGRRSSDRTGQLPESTINHSGIVGVYAGVQREETRLAQYISQTGHNIPRVFWNFMNERGLVYERGRYSTGPLMDWVFTLGYPISEAYWTRVRVGGVPHDVLVQPFERRVLTYTPAAPSGWQVQMGNVGRHYYQWRYGKQLPS
jgi:hypothetical protein